MLAVRNDVDDEAFSSLVVELERFVWMGFGERWVQIRKDHCDGEGVVQRWADVQTKDGFVG